MKSLCEWFGVNRNWYVFNLVVAFCAAAASTVFDFGGVPVHGLCLVPFFQVGLAVHDEVMLKSFWDRWAYSFPRTSVAGLITAGPVFGGFVLGIVIKSFLGK
jgi:hypothetical protein